MRALRDYAVLRDELQPRPKEPSFFVSLTRNRLSYAVVSQTFRQLVDDAGVGADAPSPPRLHDLRHTFAVRDPARLVPRGRRRAGQDPLAVDLPGAPRASLHLLVPVGCAGTARPGRCPTGHCLVGGPVMTLIAPTLQAFFTDRLAEQRQASPRTIAAYRDTLRLLLGFVHQQNGAALRAGLGRPGRHDDLRVPEPPGNRAAQQRQDPQRAADSDPLAVLLRRPSSSRTRPADPACPGHPAEAVRQADRDVPDPTGDPRAASPHPTSPDGKADGTGP